MLNIEISKIYYFLKMQFFLGLAWIENWIENSKKLKFGKFLKNSKFLDFFSFEISKLVFGKSKARKLKFWLQVFFGSKISVSKSKFKKN
jgi:hypothetical protein